MKYRPNLKSQLNTESQGTGATHRNPLKASITSDNASGTQETRTNHTNCQEGSANNSARNKWVMQAHSVWKDSAELNMHTDDPACDDQNAHQPTACADNDADDAQPCDRSDHDLLTADQRSLHRRPHRRSGGNAKGANQAAEPIVPDCAVLPRRKRSNSLSKSSTGPAKKQAQVPSVQQEGVLLLENHWHAPHVQRPDVDTKQLHKGSN